MTTQALPAPMDRPHAATATDPTALPRGAARNQPRMETQ